MPFARDRGLAHQLVRLRGSRQVCLRERIPGTPQPAGVRPGYERAAGVHILRMPKNIIHLYPLRCYYPRKDTGNSNIMNVA